MTPRTKPVNYPQLFLLASSHFMLDAYSGFLSPILPLLIAKFGLSLTLAALLLSAYQLLASTGQALFGFVCHIFAVPMMIRQLFWNWQIRRRSLDPFPDFMKSGDWFPRVRLSGANAAILALLGA